VQSTPQAPFWSFFEISAQFSDTLHSHYAINVYLYETAVTSMVEVCFAHKNRITPRTSLRDQFSHVLATAHQLVP
jgi:hypothetical protein